jgi:hypothetical protein
MTGRQLRACVSDRAAIVWQRDLRLKPERDFGWNERRRKLGMGEDRVRS